MLSHVGWLILLTAIVVAIGTLFVTVEGPHGKVIRMPYLAILFVMLLLSYSYLVTLYLAKTCLWLLIDTR